MTRFEFTVTRGSMTHYATYSITPNYIQIDSEYGSVRVGVGNAPSAIPHIARMAFSDILRCVEEEGRRTRGECPAGATILTSPPQPYEDDTGNDHPVI